MIALCLSMVAIVTGGKWATSTVSMIEHSYLSSMDANYLSQERLLVFSQFGYFSRVCPPPSLQDLLLVPSLDAAYSHQEQRYLSSENLQERTKSLGLLDKVFGYFLTQQAAESTIEIWNKARDQAIDEKPRAPPGTVKSNIYEFYNNNYEFREVLSMNVQMKARPLIAILFVCIFCLVIFRLTKNSEKWNIKITKSLSLFWFFATIQLYLELSWLSLEAQPKSYSKVLFLGLVPLEQASNYVPEILNLLLFLICLFFFFSLIFRFNEIFGQDEVHEPLTQQVLLEQ